MGQKASTVTFFEVVTVIISCSLIVAKHEQHERSKVLKYTCGHLRKPLEISHSRALAQLQCLVLLVCVSPVALAQTFEPGRGGGVLPSRVLGVTSETNHSTCHGRTATHAVRHDSSRLSTL